MRHIMRGTRTQTPIDNSLVDDKLEETEVRMEKLEKFVEDNGPRMLRLEQAYVGTREDIGHLRAGIEQVHVTLSSMGRQSERTDMRFEQLHERIGAVERDVAVMRSNYVTREDLQRELHAMTWRMYGALATTVVLLTGLLGGAMARGFHWFGL